MERKALVSIRVVMAVLLSFQCYSPSLENVILKAGLSKDAVTINLTHKHGTVERLHESKVICTTDEKVNKVFAIIGPTSLVAPFIK